MIEVKRIQSGKETIMEPLKELYTQAFPPEERRPLDTLTAVIENNEELFFSAVFDDDQLAGLVVYWVLPNLIFLEHLAIFSEMRNRKIGQQVLTFLAENYDVRILEVEPICDEMTERRVNYYRRNGYEILDDNYFQPPYSDQGKQLPLWIMGSKSVSPEKLPEYIRTIKRKVYNYKN